MSQDQPRGSRWTALLCWGGLLWSVAASLSYFLVVPHVSFAWRDSGHYSVGLALLGVVLGGAGWLRARSLRERSALPFLCLVIAGGLTGLLAGYIYWLSYQLPPADNVLDVGAKAPSFRLKDQGGVERTLESFDNERLLLVFFRGHW